LFAIDSSDLLVNSESAIFADRLVMRYYPSSRGAICLFALFTAMSISITGCTTSKPNAVDRLAPAARILDAAQRAALLNWMLPRDVRLATAEDCECGDDISHFRITGPWGKPIPDYEPYVEVGDFNNDGQPDFAVVVVSSNLSKPAGGTLLIFNGPVSLTSRPAYVGKAELFPRQALFISPVKEGYLLAGPFESEGCIFRPKGSSYSEDCSDPGEGD
jgi:hypothetical protein